MPELDILYMTRVQQERFLDQDEFDRVKDSFVLTLDKLKPAQEKMATPHPLPRVTALLQEVDDDPRAAYFRQVESGKFVRMALLSRLIDWKNDPTHVMPVKDGLSSEEAAGYRCSNANCICNREPVKPKFKTLSDGSIRCQYCDSKAK